MMSSIHTRHILYIYINRKCKLNIKYRTFLGKRKCGYLEQFLKLAAVPIFPSNFQSIYKLKKHFYVINSSPVGTAMQCTGRPTTADQSANEAAKFSSRATNFYPPRTATTVCIMYFKTGARQVYFDVGPLDASEAA